MFKKYQLRSYNFHLVLLLIITSVFGVLVVNSADSEYTFKQCIGLSVAIALMILISFIDYKIIFKYYWLWYAICIVLLIAVEIKGKNSHGATRWIEIMGIRFQPSELAKLVLIIVTAKILSMYKDFVNNWKFLVILSVVLGIPLLLIVTQPDLSTTILVFVILFSIIFCAGLSYRIIGLAILIVAPLLIGGLLYISNENNELFFLEDYQRNRIMSFFNPEENDAGVYQQEYSVKAIGSGQLSGKGLNTSDPTSMKNLNYIAEAHTDFIFAVIGEELGFVGCMFTIVLLALIVIECIITAIGARDFAGRLYCCGVASYIALQSFINLGVVTQVLPNTGVPLPFISYGLSSMFVLYISMGIILNICIQRQVLKDDDIFAKDFKG